MSYGTISVGTSATEITAGNTKRRSLLICNTESAKTVYVGPDTSVTTANGFPLYPNQSTSITKFIAEHYHGPVYGIVAAGTADVRYWEMVV